MVPNREITLRCIASVWWDRIDCMPLGFRVLQVFFNSSVLNVLLSPMEINHGVG